MSVVSGGDLPDAGATARSADAAWLVDRERELERFQYVLARETPAFVLLVGDTGMGKSTLLRAVRSWAERDGWTVIPGIDQPDLSVALGTTVERFASTVYELLDSDGPAGAIENAPQRDLDLLVQQLAAFRTLLVVDGYRADTSFASWFKHKFLRDVRRAGRPLVVVVSETPGIEEALGVHADELLELTELGREAVSRHFEMLGRHLDPPMDAAELEVYVEASLAQPEVAARLTRVLQLATRTG
jgi:hypothetical protein